MSTSFRPEARDDRFGTGPHPLPPVSLRIGRCLIGLLGLFVASEASADWRQFRGAEGASTAGSAELPTDLSGDDHIRWNQELPAKGVSGPIVVGDRVFVSSSGGRLGDCLFVTCYATEDGRRLWNRRFWATGRPYCHPTSANAAPTPCSDGEHVFAFFSSNDVVCLDLDGNLIWFRGLTYDYPQAANDVGMSSSPIVVGDVVIVQVENQGDSFVAALDKATGETRWKHSRPRSASWSSPLAFSSSSSGAPVVLLQGREALSAIDATDGKLAWEIQGSCNIIPSVAAHSDLLIAPLNGLTAMRVPGGSADPKVVWESSKLAPGSASPVVHSGRVFVLNRAGVLIAVDLKDGTVEWQSRVGGQYWATPVASGTHMYLFDSDGKAHVADLSQRGKVISTWDMKEPILGSPAVSGDSIFVRGDRHLWRISKPRA